ncbi:peptidoglycan-binding protein [Streptomyces sp. NBC_00878]|uniref:peptidoglycan-binding protein n=1 Tax=Streptomyces sp. NBC_00878 TaxID=2975854 RepID=UPI002253630C|nr:peptidoglycan-binding protein [Streptomyces sp. NBC_00878]MCX4908430.1 peptidoglycan-binding protein [Streptomyces sp. NBC_00878]
MAAPVFEEFDPESDCDCPGCTHWRHVLPHSTAPGAAGFGGHPAAHRALVVAAAAGTALGAGHAVPAVAAAAHAPLQPGVPATDEPDTPQGGEAPLHGPGGVPAKVKAPPTTRAEIINRAKEWVAAEVPYSMSAYWSDGYRQDCSGFVSMAWNLGGNEWTGSLDKFGVRISREQLEPGDILLFHNPADPVKGSHVVIFGGWTDYTQDSYVAYEEARPQARKQATPFAYWKYPDRYLAYRYKGLKVGTGGTGGTGSTGSTAGTAGTGDTPGTGDTGDTGQVSPAAPNTSDGPSAPSAPSASAAPSAPATPVTYPVRNPAAVPYPGAAAFGPGANNAYVTRLGRMLIARGAASYYTAGQPGPRWSDADRRATHAFQRAQGWTGAAADGFPGPTTWSYLVNDKGRDIVAPSGGSPGEPARPPAGGVASHGVPGYPGRALFRPGASNEYVTRLGKQLVKKGFGKYYTQGPGPRWGEDDRRNVEAFQRAQGWRGGAADGYPGPETWRRLFF